jgi:hypothetical protein
MDIIERKKILAHELVIYHNNNYRVVSQTDTTVQLRQPKKYKVLWLILFFLPYFLYKVTRKENTVFIEVNEQGKVITHGKMELDY